MNEAAPARSEILRREREAEMAEGDDEALSGLLSAMSDARPPPSAAAAAQMDEEDQTEIARLMAAMHEGGSASARRPERTYLLHW